MPGGLVGSARAKVLVESVSLFGPVEPWRGGEGEGEEEDKDILWLRTRLLEHGALSASCLVVYSPGNCDP